MRGRLCTWLALVLAGPPATRPAVAELGTDAGAGAAGLRYMSLYGWETTLTAGMAGWTNLPLGPVYNRTAVPSPTLPELVAASISAHQQLRAPFLWALPPGIVSRGATAPPRGWEAQLAVLHSHVAPLVDSGIVAGFFLGDEQCGNGTCVVAQLGVVAQRLHLLFDRAPATRVLVYANEALEVCNDQSGWVVPAGIDLFSIDVCKCTQAISRRYFPGMFLRGCLCVQTAPTEQPRSPWSSAPTKAACSQN